AKFARDSQAIGVILNVQTFRGSTYLNDFGQENFQSLGVPVVVVSGVQAQNMQIMLKKASYDGLQTKVFIKSNTLDIIAEKEHEENLANVGSNYIAKEAVFLPKFK
uniref:Uncharacterized protein n=1 Tax=Romanomermis culicivorax TaxID=13658 RepID=A0A915HQA8_ROMCU